MSTVLLNMHMCKFLQEMEDKGDHSSPEGDSDTEEQSTVAGTILWFEFKYCDKFNYRKLPLQTS